jgi:hypothetical protein
MRRRLDISRCTSGVSLVNRVCDAVGLKREHLQALLSSLHGLAAREFDFDTLDDRPRAEMLERRRFLRGPFAETECRVNGRPLYDRRSWSHVLFGFPRERIL